MYEQFLKTTRNVSKFYDKVSFKELSKKEFLDKLVYVGIGQIHGEYTETENDFVNRIVC